MRWCSALIVLCLLVVPAGSRGSGSQGRMSTPTKRVSLNQEFSVKIGQEARIHQEGLAVVFQAVPREARCPQGIQCIWGGFAVVQVQVTKTGQASAVVDLSTHQAGGMTKSTYLNYEVQLVSLHPYPRYGGTIDPRSYVANLLISKK
jgi:hypothetical protein